MSAARPKPYDDAKVQCFCKTTKEKAEKVLLANFFDLFIRFVSFYNKAISFIDNPVISAISSKE